jgi:hypothetical protein
MEIINLSHSDVIHRISIERLVVGCSSQITFLLERQTVFHVFVATLKGNAVDITEGNSAKLSMFHLSTTLMDVMATFGAIEVQAAVRVVRGRPFEKTDGGVRALLSEYFVCWAAKMEQFVLCRR